MTRKLVQRAGDVLMAPILHDTHPACQGFLAHSWNLRSVHKPA